MPVVPPASAPGGKLKARLQQQRRRVVVVGIVVAVAAAALVLSLSRRTVDDLSRLDGHPSVESRPRPGASTGVSRNGHGEESKPVSIDDDDGRHQHNAHSAPPANGKTASSRTSKPLDGASSPNGVAVGAQTDVGVMRLQFAMDDAFATAWRKSSERLTFDTTLTVICEPSAGGSDGGDAQGCPTPGGSGSSGASSIQRPLRVKITFYGKSSLKTRYTARRSLQVDVVEPDANLGVWWPAAESVWGSRKPLRRFVLLSLWEDTYRLAYRSSVLMLREAGLFFPANRFVDLQCRGQDEASVAKVCGASLGAYLMLE